MNVSGEVLVWQKNPGDPVVHSDGTCLTLSVPSVVPGRSVKFAGRGTAGWMPESEAMRLRDARKCQRCW